MTTAIITLPDGRKAKLTGPDRASIEAQAQQLTAGSIIPNRAPTPVNFQQQEVIPGIPATQASTVTSGPSGGARQAGTRAAAQNFLGNIAQLPNAALTAVMNLPSVRSMLPPESVMKVPGLGDQVIPTPSGEQIVAGLETAATIPTEGMNLSERYGQNLADAQALAAEHPNATSVGGALGDAATIATGRIPARGLFRAAAPAVKPARVARTPKPGFQNVLDTAANKLASTVGKGAVKAGEAGLEGATLAILQNGDPLQTAAFAAGAQSVGSLALTASAQVRKRPVTSIFMGLMLGHQLFKAVGPGERNMFESSDEAINEIVAGYGLGFLASMAGANRVSRKGFGGNFPESVTDALTAIPRGSLTSLWEDLAREEEAGKDTTLQVIEKFTTSPSAFNDNQRKRLERAFRNGNLASEVEQLMKVESFRQSLDGE